MKEEILNKLSAINYNLRELEQSTDMIRTEINKMKVITEVETTIVNNFYKSFIQFITTQEVDMYLMILKTNNSYNKKGEAALERKHRKHHKGRIKTFS